MPAPGLALVSHDWRVAPRQYAATGQPQATQRLSVGKPENIRATARTGHLKCRAIVGDKTAAEAELRFMMVDPDIE